MTHYLVKWCSLSYEEATWELQEDLDPEKIKEFEEIQKLPADLRHMVSRNIIRRQVEMQEEKKREFEHLGARFFAQRHLGSAQEENWHSGGRINRIFSVTDCFLHPTLRAVYRNVK